MILNELGGSFSVGASQVVPVVKNLPANAGNSRDTGLIPGSGRSLEKEIATHSSILAWRIPGAEEVGGCFSSPHIAIHLPFHI